METKTIDQIKSQIEEFFNDLHCEKIQAFQMLGKYKQIIFTVGYFHTVAGRQIRYSRGGNSSGIYYFTEGVNCDLEENEMFQIVKRDIERFLQSQEKHFPDNLNEIYFQTGFLIAGTTDFMKSGLSLDEKARIMSEL